MGIALESSMNRLVSALRIVVLGLVAWSATVVSLQAQDAVTKELLRLEDVWGKAEVAKDGDTLGRLLAEDYIGIGPTGSVTDKARYVSAVKTNQDVYVSGEDSDRRVRVYGDAVVDTGLWTQTVKKGEGTETSRYRWSSVWIKQGDGRWLCVSMQTVQVP